MNYQVSDGMTQKIVTEFGTCSVNLKDQTHAYLYLDVSKPFSPAPSKLHAHRWHKVIEMNFTHFFKRLQGNSQFGQHPY